MKTSKKKISGCLGALNSLMSAISTNSLSLILQISGAAHPITGANRESSGLATEASRHSMSLQQWSLDSKLK